MVAADHDNSFAILSITNAANLGAIVPPSIALIIYVSVTYTSLAMLFAASGVIRHDPHHLTTWFSLRKGYPHDLMPTIGSILTTFKGAFWGLELPVVF